MTRLKEPYELQKVTLNLRKGDWPVLRVRHGREGASKAVRQLVIDYVDRYLKPRPRGADFSALVRSLKNES